MKTLDFTKGIELNESRDIEMTVEFSNRAMFVFHGQTKKQCREQYKKRFGNLKGITSIEFRVYDCELIDYVDPGIRVD